MQQAAAAAAASPATTTDELQENPAISPSHPSIGYGGGGGS